MCSGSARLFSVLGLAGGWAGNNPDQHTQLFSFHGRLSSWWWVLLALSVSLLAWCFCLRQQDSSFDGSLYIFQSSAGVSLTLPNHFVIPFSEHSTTEGKL